MPSPTVGVHQCMGLTISDQRFSIKKNIHGEWNLYYIAGIIFMMQIDFCPFCGIRLNQEFQNNSKKGEG